MISSNEPTSSEQIKEIFFSYAREDKDKVEELVNILTADGRHVFWDEQLVVGADFQSVINESMRNVHSVVVAWSKDSIDSNWVRYEASIGAHKGILVPITLDGTLPPSPFDRSQTLNFSGWDGSEEDQRLVKLREGIGQALRRSREKTAKKRKVRTRRSALVALAALVTVVALLGFIAWRELRNETVGYALRNIDGVAHATDETAHIRFHFPAVLEKRRIQTKYGGNWKTKDGRLNVDALNFGRKRTVDDLLAVLQKREGREAVATRFDGGFELRGTDTDKTQFIVRVESVGRELRGLSVVYSNWAETEMKPIAEKMVQSFVAAPAE